MKRIFLWFWQLPQNIIGFFSIVFLTAYRPTYDGDPEIYTHYKRGVSSVCLGDYIIINGYQVTDKIVLHEKGHQKQSLILGWLYLPLIGLPSLIGNLLHRFIKFDYYKQPWEAWADKLGGVKRY